MELQMHEDTYDSWPLYVGRTLLLVTPFQKVWGTMLGLASAKDGLTGAPPEPPWALLTASGVMFVDPTNPATALYSEKGLVGSPPAPPTPGIDRQKVQQVLDACHHLMSQLEDRMFTLDQARYKARDERLSE